MIFFRINTASLQLSGKEKESAHSPSNRSMRENAYICSMELCADLLLRVNIFLIKVKFNSNQ